MTSNQKISRTRFYALFMIGAGLIILGAGLAFVLASPQAAPAAGLSSEFSTVAVKVDFPAPDLPLQDLSGQAVSLADYKGSVLLVNLWATWCPPCKQELPDLQSYYEKYRSSGFVLIGIDQEETLEVVKPFVSQYGLTFPIWLDENYLAQRLFNTINLPSSFVIDRTGRVRLMWVGAVSQKFLEKNITKIIKE